MPGVGVSPVSRGHGAASDQIFTFRRPMAQGELITAGAIEKLVPASKYRLLEAQTGELQRVGEQEDDAEMRALRQRAALDVGGPKA